MPGGGQRGQTQLDRPEPDVVLVYVAWDVVQTKIGDLTDAARADANRGQLKRMIEVAGSTGAQVVVVDARLQNAIMTADQVNAFNALLDEALTAHPEVRKLKLQEQVCTATPARSPPTQGRRSTSTTAYTSSPAGRTQVAPWLKTQVLRIAG